MKKLRFIILWCFVLANVYSFGQRIKSAEYFFDADPGINKGKAITFTNNLDSINRSDSFITTGLGLGFHNLFLRVKDSLGNWSLYEGRTFLVDNYVSPPVTLKTPKSEYFFDNDPGIGKGKPITVTVTGDSITWNDSFSSKGLKQGFHGLFIRVQNSLGIWSLYEGREFLIDSVSTVGVTFKNPKAEYFYDYDPGIGKGKQITISVTSDSILYSDSFPTTGLKPGFHGLFLRVQNSLGVWSLYEGREFLIDSVSTIGVNFKNANAEYFYDFDPGIGKGTQVSVSLSSDSILVNDSFPTTGLKAGYHGLFLRVQNSTGKWSLYEGREFLIDAVGGLTTNKIVNAEYFFDTDPGIGKGKSIPSFTPADSVLISSLIDITGLASGSHNLIIRAKDQTNAWSMNASAKFFICATALAAPVISGVTNYCSGDDIVLAGSTVTGATHYVWHGPKGFTDTSLNIKISGADSTSSGVYTLVAIRSGGTACDTSNIATDTVKVYPAAVAAVASNQSVCIGSSVSIGAPTNSGLSYSWTSSSGGFTSAIANPSVSPTITTTYTLVVTNGNSCSNTNSVVIGISSLPSASVVASSTVCSKSSISIGSLGIVGNNYSWSSSPSGFSSLLANPLVSPTITTTYTLTETNENHCTNSNTVVITVNSLPLASVIASSTICNSANISIGATSVSGSSYSWTSSPAGFSSTLANPSVSPTANTTYVLTETNANSCTNTNSVTITVASAPAALVIPNASVCSGKSIAIGGTAVSGSSYSWASIPSGYGSTLSNPAVTPKAPTTYTLTETNAGGCSKTNSVTINVNPLPNAHFSVNYFGITTYLHADDSSFVDSSYHWTLGDGNNATAHLSKHIYPSNKTYDVNLKLTSANGCVNSFDSTVNITVSGIDPQDQDIDKLLVLPNPFHSSVTLEFDLKQRSDVQIAVYDLAGREVVQLANNNLATGQQKIEIDGDKYQFEPGVYLLKLITSQGTITRRIVKL